MVVLWGWASAVFWYAATLAATFCFLGAAELAFPRVGGDPVPGRARLKAVLFWSAWVPITVATLQLGQFAWGMVGVAPLFPSLDPAWLPRPLAVVAGAIAAAAVGDLFYYWCHRIQHRFFWRFHRVHHSPRNLCAMTAYHHVSEEAFKLVLYSAPVAFFVNDPFGLPVVGALLGFQGFYLHSPTALNVGPFLRRLVIDNRFHRIHHSTDPAHYDRNFGVVTPVWDMLFRTAYFPRWDEWPATGLAEVDEPRDLKDFVLQPLK